MEFGYAEGWCAMGDMWLAEPAKAHINLQAVSAVIVEEGEEEEDFMCSILLNNGARIGFSSRAAYSYLIRQLGSINP